MRIFLLAALLALGGGVQAVEPTLNKGAVVVIPVTGQISEAQFYFLRRVVKAAESAGASALVLDMDTPGGALDATEKICQLLLKTKIPTYTYVNTDAGSAGALIALATKNIYVAPVSAIGAAAPVLSSGEEVPKTMNAKIVSFSAGYFRSVAEQNGYDPNLVDAFMNVDKEVKIGDRVIKPAGEVLTLSAKEATELINGKPLLARGIAPDLRALCEQAGLAPDAMVRVEPSGFEQIAFWITALAPILLLGGMLGAWIEFKSPGFGIAGILSALCFLLFFAGHYLAGLTGFEVLAVFVLGVLLVLLELIFFPGVVLLATVGLALMIGALLFAMVDFYPAQPLQLAPEMFVAPLINLSIAVILFFVGVALFARFLPNLPLFNRLVLARETANGPSFSPKLAELVTPVVAVGDTGKALTILRPAGRVELGGNAFDAISDGEFLEPGEAVRVLAVRTDHIIVARA